MGDTTILALWFFGIPATLGAGMLVMWGIELLVSKAENTAIHCANVLHHSRMRITWKSNTASDRQQFSTWLAARMGQHSLGSQVDDRLVDAQQKADFLRVLIDEEIPKAALQCVETHRLIARVTGAYHLSEIAYEPECRHLRETIAWILTHTVGMLDEYPLRFDDKRLLHNSIVLKKRALPTCRRCPYIQSPTAEAPLLCPTAELVQIKRSAS